MKGVAEVLGNPLYPVDLRDPFCHLAEHSPVVDLLKCLTLNDVTTDLADEQNHRRRVLKAVCTPMLALVAPGPRVTKQIPGRPVSLP
jgi:hypothetical protein